MMAGKLCKMTYNVYFGGDDLADLVSIFKEVTSRIDQSDLCAKPSKIKIDIKTADILGLCWQGGTLTPSQHKLGPLAPCDRPATIKGLCSFLRRVHFNKICLNGAKLSLATKLLDQQIPSTRLGKEKINWTPELIQSFTNTHDILKNPLTVMVPREGDHPLLAVDACSSIPAGGSKLIIQQLGVPGYLPSFNFGCRLPTNLKTKFMSCETDT